jgi:hypothetical protein
VVAWCPPHVVLTFMDDFFLNDKDGCSAISLRSVKKIIYGENRLNS